MKLNDYDKRKQTIQHMLGEVHPAVRFFGGIILFSTFMYVLLWLVLGTIRFLSILHN